MGQKYFGTGASRVKGKCGAGLGEWTEAEAGVCHE